MHYDLCTSLALIVLKWIFMLHSGLSTACYSHILYFGVFLKIYSKNMIQSKSESKIAKVILVSANEKVTVLDLPAQKELLLEMLENQSSETRFEDYVFVRKESGYKKVKVADVVCLEAQQNYCNLFMADGSKQTVSMPMNEVYEYFNPMYFKRVHRSFVVNLEHVDSYVGNMLVMDDNRIITIGRNYREQIASEFVCIGSRKRVREKKMSFGG